MADTRLEFAVVNGFSVNGYKLYILVETKPRW